MCCGAKTPSHTGPGVAVSCPEGTVHAMPDAEVIARARGVNLCNVTPTGLGGKVIIRPDVLRYLGQGV